jgi:hypothetical protein
MRRRFWVEVGAATGSLALLALTIVWQDWIELVFRVHPDHGGGGLERAIVIVACALTVVFALSARLEWRRAGGLHAAGETAA